MKILFLHITRLILSVIKSKRIKLTCVNFHMNFIQLISGGKTETWNVSFRFQYKYVMTIFSVRVLNFIFFYWKFFLFFFLCFLTVLHKERSTFLLFYLEYSVFCYSSSNILHKEWSTFCYSTSNILHKEWSTFCYSTSNILPFVILPRIFYLLLFYLLQWCNIFSRVVDPDSTNEKISGSGCFTFVIQ